MKTGKHTALGILCSLVLTGVFTESKAWQADALGRVVLLAPRGAAPAQRSAHTESLECSRATVARWSRDFAGSGLALNRSLPPRVSVPPPGPGSAVAGAMPAEPARPAPGPLASISSADVRGLTGSIFVSTVLNSDGLDASFFSTTDTATLAALAEPRVQEVVSQLNSDLASDPLPHAARLDRGLYFLRAAAFVDFYSTALNYSAALKSNVISLLIAVGNNPQFLAPGFLDPRAAWAVASDSWLALPGQVDRITALLRRYLDTPSLQNLATEANRAEGNMMFALLSGLARTANQDPNWAGRYTTNLMQALHDLALTLPASRDIEFVINNTIYTLGHLRTGEPVAASQGRAHAILSQVLQARAVDSGPYLEALLALENPPYNDRLANGTPVDIDGYRQQLAVRVFSHTYTFDGGSMIFRTPLDAGTVQQLYDALREVKAQFFRVTQALRPVDGDSNAVLTLRIYGSRADYTAYQRFLYRLGTDNGGIYIENGATFFTYQRTPQESIYTLEELARHEYIHYLDAYYLLVPRFGDAPWYDNDHLTWHSEGLAEFLAGSRRTNGVPVRQGMLNQTLSPGPPLTIAQIIGATYASGFGFYPNAAMFFAFLHERHPELLWPYFHILYTNNLAAYDALTQGWRAHAALQAEYGSYLTNASTGINAGTRLAAEAIPTGYKPAFLFGVTPAQIQSDLQGVLPGGALATIGDRFHFSSPLSVTVSNADATTPERFQAEFARRLDEALSTLTPRDAHYRCATAWFEQLDRSGHTASATLHLESWFNPNTAPAAVMDPTNLVFDTLYSDDASPPTLTLNVVNTSASPLIIQSVTLAGPDASAFDFDWDAAGNPSLAGRGTISIPVSVRPESLAGLAPGWHTATLNFLTANGTPALVQIPLTFTLATPLFVDQHAPPGGDGSSWSNAFSTLSAALSAAPTGTEAIFVAAGIYPEAIALRASLHLYGGFSGLRGARETRASQRQPEVFVTTLDGAPGGTNGAVVRVVDFAGTQNALVDGFTITGGQTRGAVTAGAGVNIDDVTGEAILRNCVIQFNQTDGYGGGILVRSSKARLEDCSILQNIAGYGGGVAVFGPGANATLRRCWIAGNEAVTTNGSGAGGGLFIYSSGQATVEDTRCVGNTADSAAGFEVSGLGCQLTLRGTLVAANVSRGWFGGGANYASSQLQADQCVFFRNIAGPGYGFAGLGTVYGATSLVQNCMFVGHQNSEAAGLGWGGSLGLLQARHCLFHGNTRDFSDGTRNATGAAQLNALTNVFTHTFAADPRWLVPPPRAGTVTAATYNASNRTTRLTLSGASLAPGSWRSLVLHQGANAAAAVFTNTSNTITVFGQHDTLASWTQWQPLDFHLGHSSPAIDVGEATTAVLDPDGFPRGVDVPEASNGPGAGFDLGLYEYRGSFAFSPLLRIGTAGDSVKLLWPLGLPAWRIYSSPDLRHWRPRPEAPLVTNGWHQLSLPRRPAVEFHRLGTP